MDYSPSPSRVKPEYTFLDKRVDTTSYSPVKRPGSKSVMNDRQKRFYNQYPDLKSPLKKPVYQNEETTTNSRLFRNIDQEQVLASDKLKIQSDMVDKIIKKNKMLESKNKDMIDLADSLKIKLSKYKNANERLEDEIAKLKNQNEFFNKQSEGIINDLDDLKKQNNALLKEINDLKSSKKEEDLEFVFNPDNTDDIFQEEEKETEEETEKEHKQESKPDDSNSRIESKIDHFLQELEFLKELTLQQRQPQQLHESTEKHNDKEPSSPQPQLEIKKLHDQDLITSETQEVLELEDQVNHLKKQMAIREENKLRKYKLKQEMQDLISKLQSDEIPKELQTPVESPKLTKKVSVHSPCRSGCPICHEAGHISSSTDIRTPTSKVQNSPLNARNEGGHNTSDTRHENITSEVDDTKWY